MSLIGMLASNLGRMKEVEPSETRAGRISHLIKVLCVAGLITGMSSACVAASVDLTTATPELPATATPAPSSTQTETLVPTVTATATATLSPAEAPIDQGLLLNFPTSYKDLVTRPEGCVMAPDPLEDLDVFNQWKRDKLVPLLGDLRTREPNVRFNSPAYCGFTNPTNIPSVTFLDMNWSSPVSGEQAIFCFTHDGFLYPVIVWTIGYRESGGNYGTFGLILFNGSIDGQNESGVDIIRLLNDREQEILKVGLFRGSSPEFLPEAINEMIDLGMRGFEYEGILPGVTKDDIGVGPAVIEPPWGP